VTAKELMYQQALFKFSSMLKQKLISATDMSSTINSSLKCIADFMDADRAYIFKNSSVNGRISTSQFYEYAKAEVPSQIDNKDLQNIGYLGFGLELWLDAFLNKRAVYGATEDFPTAISEQLKSQNVKSVLCTPIFIDDKLWGFMGLDDCHSARIWDDLEISTLQELALSIVVVIIKQKLRDNIAELNEKLRKKSMLQRKELQEKEKMLIDQSNYAQMGEMINMIAHQWRQPLNAVSAACLKLSLHSELDTITKELTDETVTFIDSQSQKMSNIINDFMNFNKPTDNSKLRMKSIVDNVLNMVHAQFTNRSIELNIDVDETIEIFHNRKYVEHSLLNILSNSKDAFEDSNDIGKLITISTALHVDDIELIIEDNAGGISEDVLKKMYNPYYTTKVQGKGTGIGLYMTKDMLEKIPGTKISTKSDNGCTTTTITFKRLENE
ncbi:MAG: GAF domain-containing sensor histidine kinase, partial [Campylobacterota bacterium]|nr:GAF domain-containing sensor histidine kinase [Campylobacterota bacterium]